MRECASGTMYAHPLDMNQAATNILDIAKFTRNVKNARPTTRQFRLMSNSTRLALDVAELELDVALALKIAEIALDVAEQRRGECKTTAALRIQIARLRRTP